ncbi:uncharacterized protein EV422DRAFT_606009 [Fimicolochytrium jonesii]|uniref:uncharacterized protein n=1 Tax=Fimicolochytrium jonesii TaxID=1396493 RepID=UPI0022FDFEE0|nr:uncharacterized protein EV422DRAFT_606009 [Fimicolochytrium jonesii]KAI8825234.1 hypothetical protein EV422DRAFT_606009 [Fimicolochytrium jonesii]
MKRTKLHQQLEELLAKLPEEEEQALKNLPYLSSILRTLAPKVNSVAVRDCTDKDIRRVLQLDTSAVKRTNPSWALPEDVPRYSPTKWLKSSWAMIDKFWNLNSENSTRTIIDLFLLDVMAQAQNREQDESAKIMSTWTEVSLSHIHEDFKDALHTMLFVGEAKVAGGERSLWQIIAYCGMLRKLRLKHVASSPYSHNATIYGFVTDSIVWEFVRVDNNGKVFLSPAITSHIDVQTWLGYTLKCARQSTRTASPAVSQAELQEFSISIERFRKLAMPNPDDEDDPEEDARAARELREGVAASMAKNPVPLEP